MKQNQKLLVVFLLNLGFSVLEGIGGWLNGSVAVLSDAVHDFGDALGIGVSLVLEKKSLQKADDMYTYGYGRYAVLGGLLVCLSLVIGCVGVIVRAVQHLHHPVAMGYTKVIILAVVGIAVNVTAFFLTKEGESTGHKAVHLHVLEDVWGWIAVLISAVVIRFTGMLWIDPLLSTVLAIVIGFKALARVRNDIGILLDRVPTETEVAKLREVLNALEGVEDIEDLRVRSLDGVRHEATIRISCIGDYTAIKMTVRQKAEEFGIVQVTIETN